MNVFTKFKELLNNAGKRTFKLKSIGGTTVTAKEAMPYGFDGNPIAGTTAILSYTTNASERVVTGYVNTFQEALEGESRMYAVDPVKNEVAGYVWCHANGTVEINGLDYSAVRYQVLNTQLQNLVTLINAQLTAIQAGTTPIGGTYVAVPVTLNIATAESPTVKIK